MKLAAREVELLQLIADGHTSKTAAGVMCITQNTANGYLRTIHTKLNANTTTHAVAIAFRHGFIE